MTAFPAKLKVFLIILTHQHSTMDIYYFLKLYFIDILSADCFQSISSLHGLLR
jgi:hypothetical protein